MFLAYLEERMLGGCRMTPLGLSGLAACQSFTCDPDTVQGRYVFKLLAVDVPSAAGPEQRIYLEGDQRTYDRGAVLREMRDPLLNVSASQLIASYQPHTERPCASHLPDQACSSLQPSNIVGLCRLTDLVACGTC